jgi:ligand-binding sensor domain-containing protein
MRQPLITLLVWLSCLAFPATNTSAQHRFDSWTTENGLPQSSVNSILQTRDGFLWFTTFGGLVRYDGVRFQVFNTGNTKGLRSGRFTRLYEDRAGNLWINTEGQGVTRYKDEVFTTYTTADGLPSNQVSMMYEDPAGNLRAQTDGFRPEQFASHGQLCDRKRNSDCAFRLHDDHNNLVDF